MRKNALALILLVAPILAHANQAAAHGCVAGLHTDAKKIYATAAPGFAAAANKPGEVGDSAVGLVKAGKIAKGTARYNALAALALEGGE